VSSPLETLNDDEVRQIAVLVETLDHSTFDFIQVTVGNLKVTIGKSPGPAVAAPQPYPAVSPPAPSMPADATSPLDVPVAPAAPVTNPSPQPPGDSEGTDGTVAILAPMMGMLYAQPSPGAPPFVRVGDQVTADATVGLIEVMKLFTPVVAGMNGVIAEICVQDSQLVEYQQVLFRIRPSDVTAIPSGAESSMA